MKYLKMVGLAALAAAALMAFVGAGTASATTLCESSASTTSCVAGQGVILGTEIDFSAEDSVRLAGPLNITIATCTESTVKGKTTQLSGTPTLSGTIVSLTFGNCGTRDVTANAATTGTLSIEHIGGTDNGTVTSNDTTVTIKTIPSGLGIPETCNYLTANTDIGTLTGGLAAPTFDISATIPAETPGCPNGTWSGHYKYTGSTGFIVTD